MVHLRVFFNEFTACDESSGQKIVQLFQESFNIKTCVGLNDTGIMSLRLDIPISNFNLILFDITESLMNCYVMFISFFKKTKES